MRALEKRIESLEGPRRHYRSMSDIPTAELEAMVAPLFGGRVPTDEELRAMVDGVAGNDTEERHGDA